MFDHPGRQPESGNPGLDIHYWVISTNPATTFAHRLTWALRTDCCGEVHDAAVEGTDAGKETAAEEGIDSQATDDTNEVDETALREDPIPSMLVTAMMNQDNETVSSLW
jgi:hypothetical protein